MTYNTEKRTELLNYFKSCNGSAMTIDEICEAILKDGKGRSTVYRLISRLVDDGVIRRISDGKTRRVTYQYIHCGNCAEHLHLKCKSCGMLIHVDDVTSHILEKRIMKSEGFTLDEGALLYGICGKCSASGKENA